MVIYTHCPRCGKLVKLYNLKETENRVIGFCKCGALSFWDWKNRCELLETRVFEGDAFDGGVSP